VVLTRLASLSLFSATEAPTTRFLKNCFRLHGGMFPWYRAHVRPLCLLWIAIHVGRRPWPYVDFMDGILHVQMENKHSASSKHPMDGILRALWWRCHPMDWKIKTTSNAFTDQPRLCHRKHYSLQHHPCFRALINLQPRICRPQCSSARATGTPVASATDSKHNALLSALFWPFRDLLHTPFRKTLPLPTRFEPSRDLLSQITLVRSLLRETTVPSFFGRIQHGSTSRRPSSQPSHFLQQFILVRSLQSSSSIVCYGSVLFSVSV